MMGKKSLSLLLVFLVSFSSVWAQSTPNPMPEPYTADEFPAWLTPIRRFEIISIGAFPIALFYTRLAFDLNRYFEEGFDASFAPWPFRNEYSYKPSDDEYRRMYLVSAGIALGIGIADAIISGIKNKNKTNQF